MILTPYGHIPGSFPSEITRSYGPSGEYLCPRDPYQNQRGEVGYYHDTQLGRAALGQTIPTDYELMKSYGYLPFDWGSVQGKLPSGQLIAWAGPWKPPSGVSPGTPAAPVWLGPSPGNKTISGLRSAADDVVAELNAHNRRTFQLAVISTIAVAASALLAIFRTGGLIREDASRRSG